MPYTSEQYNYATPISSVAGLTDEESVVRDQKYFTLSDNILDGTYSPVTGDVGIWGSALPDATGVLQKPLVVTVTESLTVNALRLVGSQYVYPVAFTVEFFAGSTLQYTIAETSNSLPVYVHYLPHTLEVSSYTITVTKVSSTNRAARLYNVYNPGYVKRSDMASIWLSDTGTASELRHFYAADAVVLTAVDASVMAESAAVTVHSSDTVFIRADSACNINCAIAATDTAAVTQIAHSATRNSIARTSDSLSIYADEARTNIVNAIVNKVDPLRVSIIEPRSGVLNTIDKTRDVLPIVARDIAKLINVHSKMKEPSRQIYGKVYITYTDPILTAETNVVATPTAYNSEPTGVIDGNAETNGNLFTLYENNLTGQYVVGDAHTHYGWVSKHVSNELCEFSEPPKLTINFAERPIVDLRIIFDSTRGSVAEDFIVTFVQADGTTITNSYTGNTSGEVPIASSVPDAVSISIEVLKVSKAGYPVGILEIPVVSTFMYVGYKDVSNLVSIDLLEELTYNDEIEALGGISANEITVTLDNSNKDFYFNNASSLVASSLKRNRKIVPWLGVEVVPGEIEWYTLGTYWSYRWDVPVEGLTATVVGFDTIGLLDTTSFTEHHMQVNKTIGQLIEYVLEDAKKQLSFITYKIDSALYDVTIPYAWFGAASHTAALRKISGCYPLHIYCDRDGAICAVPQKLHLDYYYDTWSDDTNVISKNYSSLYTMLPNIINVNVKNPIIVHDQNLVEDSLTFDVASVRTRTLNFNNPYISDISVVVDCDASVQYTYTAYAWGVVINFAGSGVVRSIQCTGSALDISNTSVISQRDASSVRLNGAVTRDISSDFIQTSSLATELVERLLSLSEHDKYDATVDYRGDIALTINDPILLLNGIAPDNRYNIKRHELFWNGSLTGSADLNT